MRGVNPSTTPAAVSLTASIRRNSFTATISSASTFQNGDGVVIYGAGASHAMSTPRTPTVTQSIARVMTGAGDVVTGPTGATTYNYKIIWRDKAGGLTAASPAGTTTTGQASLGKQTVNITSMSRAADGTATVTTAAAHTLVTGAMGARRSPSRCKRLPRAARPAPPTPTSSCNTACSSFGGLPGSCLGMLEDYDKYSVYYAPDVENAGKSDEREKTPGEDRGFLWGMETWWRMEERDSGVYVQSEVVSLTRDIPAVLSWMIKPFVTSIRKKL